MRSERRAMSGRSASTRRAGNPGEPALFRMAAYAMATRFEVVLWGADEPRLRAAAEEALAEVAAMESRLSRFRGESDIHALNLHAAREPVRVDPRTFALLQRAAALSEETQGAFDVTVAPLLRAWGFLGGTGSMAREEDAAAARQVTGMALVELDPDEFTVRFLRPGVEMDLGAIGKGAAVEEAAGLLRDCGVAGALIHGGTSTVQALGRQPGGEPWQVAVRHPQNEDSVLAVAALADCALSVSAIHGKSFAEGGMELGHVLDPSTGRPVQGAVLAAVVCTSATDADALSTAVLARGVPLLERLRAARPDLSGLVAVRDGSGGVLVEVRGPALRSAGPGG